MSWNLIHHWRLQRSIDRPDCTAPQPPSDGSPRSEQDERYRARVRAIERRLKREAPLAACTPARSLRQRTMNAIYDLEFHRRYRRLPWWKTAPGGSGLVAASVIIAGVLFALMTFPQSPSLPAQPVATHSSADLDLLVSDASVEDEETRFDFSGDSLEIAALAAPEWVLQRLAPHAIRQELGAIADEAIRAADYFVSRFAAGRDNLGAAHNPPRLDGELSSPRSADH